jgi:cyclopropane-fatty-acyl-phospholipid synthase
MWEFYLQSCEAGFRHQGLSVFQMQLAKRIDAVPLTRDYLMDEPAPAQFAKPTLVR